MVLSLARSFVFSPAKKRTNSQKQVILFSLRFLSSSLITVYMYALPFDSNLKPKAFVISDVCLENRKLLSLKPNRTAVSRAKQRHPFCKLI